MKTARALLAMAVVLMVVSGCDGDLPASSPATANSASLPPPTLTPSPTIDTAVHSFVLIHTDFSSSDPVGQQPGNNFANAYIASVLILVQEDRVVAVPCGTQTEVNDLETCDGYFTDISIDDPSSLGVWTGTRDGTIAIVSATDKFLWATITFSGEAPSAPPVHFEMAVDCLAVDGTQGELDPIDDCH